MRSRIDHLNRTLSQDLSEEGNVYFQVKLVA